MQEILNIVKNMKNKNSIGFDGLPIKITKVIAYYISKLISYILNTSFEWEAIYLWSSVAHGNALYADNTSIPQKSESLEELVLVQLLGGIINNFSLQPNKSSKFLGIYFDTELGKFRVKMSWKS